MRKFMLEYYLNVLFPRELVEHHIDLNRKNEEIQNIIFLTRSLHRKIHHEIKKNPLLKERKELHKFLRANKIKKYFLKITTTKEWRQKCSTQ